MQMVTPCVYSKANNLISFITLIYTGSKIREKLLNFRHWSGRKSWSKLSTALITLTTWILDWVKPLHPCKDWDAQFEFYWTAPTFKCSKLVELKTPCWRDILILLISVRRPTTVQMLIINNKTLKLILRYFTSKTLSCWLSLPFVSL